MTHSLKGFEFQCYGRLVWSHIAHREGWIVGADCLPVFLGSTLWRLLFIFNPARWEGWCCCCCCYYWNEIIDRRRLKFCKHYLFYIPLFATTISRTHNSQDTAQTNMHLYTKKTRRENSWLAYKIREQYLDTYIHVQDNNSRIKLSHRLKRSNKRMYFIYSLRDGQDTKRRSIFITAW